MLLLLEKILPGEVIVDHLQPHMVGEDESVVLKKTPVVWDISC